MSYCSCRSSLLRHETVSFEVTHPVVLLLFLASNVLIYQDAHSDVAECNWYKIWFLVKHFN